MLGKSDGGGHGAVDGGSFGVLAYRHIRPDSLACISTLGLRVGRCTTPLTSGQTMYANTLSAAVLMALCLSLPVAAAELSATPASPPADAAPVHAAIVQDSASDDVTRAQVWLDRAHFSPGEIDGVFGSNVSKAVAGFQRSRGLTDSGMLDAPTWVELEREGAPALIDYTISAEDAAGPYIKMPVDIVAKSELESLGFGSAAEALGERFHASPALLESLNPGKKLDLAGEIIRVPNVGGASELPKGSRVIVDQSELTVTLVDADDRVIAQFPATTGSSHDPLPLGDWKIKGVARNPVFHYDPELFWDANPGNAKAVLPAGPNNPVGVTWIDLSKEHYGIHGTPEPAKIGKTESHGCIRLTNWDAVLLANSVYPGMPATLRD
jgi:lipoprotein-anchoring transpeptidase ErfK/SrfK